ncbi:hypothetical protein RvY_00364 [Ramazzottius varieornatus]|uniref:Uncharacterized protein n=1 Tax=Ramazzottius varieornatus TaxID=947166 RepID=A0A1D1UCJ0_RAMVA|nr:hypothetical protein RvY_00364 [Ramazzottius varieornatus]
MYNCRDFCINERICKIVAISTVADRSTTVKFIIDVSPTRTNIREETWNQHSLLRVKPVCSTVTRLLIILTVNQLGPKSVTALGCAGKETSIG